MIAKSIIIFLVFLQIVPVILLGERKLLGRFQSRIGPNRVGPYGAMQPMADVLKLLSKEAFTPETAVPWMMAIAPVISVVDRRGHDGRDPVRALRRLGRRLRPLRHRRVDRHRSTSSPSARSPSTG